MKKTFYFWNCIDLFPGSLRKAIGAVNYLFDLPNGQSALAQLVPSKCMNT
jgi:hypothetical protein